LIGEKWLYKTICEAQNGINKLVIGINTYSVITFNDKVGLCDAENLRFKEFPCFHHFQDKTASFSENKDFSL
jgi:hypothetical protein